MVVHSVTFNRHLDTVHSRPLDMIRSTVTSMMLQLEQEQEHTQLELPRQLSCESTRCCNKLKPAALRPSDTRGYASFEEILNGPLPRAGREVARDKAACSSVKSARPVQTWQRRCWVHESPTCQNAHTTRPNGPIPRICDARGSPVRAPSRRHCSVPKPSLDQVTPADTTVPRPGSALEPGVYNWRRPRTRDGRISSKKFLEDECESRRRPIVASAKRGCRSRLRRPVQADPVVESQEEKSDEQTAEHWQAYTAWRVKVMDSARNLQLEMDRFRPPEN
uniref:Uncharacterized protein n=1 Tax=Noctiluca scintillans TaxID=2966 RepID=A0A7S0ZPK2_NOCSC|mmetsp:Transcript_13355/g.36716  ORF Transcript_13355/g.36716 Transcript_13355/m.36716 type:complete len:278 (+) Transcript_13355:55-888(+)